jgi:hypothetical protein
MSALPRLLKQGYQVNRLTRALCGDQLTQSRSAEISPSSLETSLATAVISPLSVDEDGSFGVAVALVGGQEVTFDGSGTVENVVGSGGQPELQRVRWRWSVHLELTMIEVEIDCCANALLVAGPAILAEELELL